MWNCFTQAQLTRATGAPLKRYMLVWIVKMSVGRIWEHYNNLSEFIKEDEILDKYLRVTGSWQNTIKFNFPHNVILGRNLRTRLSESSSWIIEFFYTILKSDYRRLLTCSSQIPSSFRSLFLRSKVPTAVSRSLSSGMRHRVVWLPPCSALLSPNYVTPHPKGP